MNTKDKHTNEVARFRELSHVDDALSQNTPSEREREHHFTQPSSSQANGRKRTRSKLNFLERNTSEVKKVRVEPDVSFLMAPNVWYFSIYDTNVKKHEFEAEHSDALTVMDIKKTVTDNANHVLIHNGTILNDLACVRDIFPDCKDEIVLWMRKNGEN